MSNLGNIKIADDVVKVIAAKVTEDVEGVYKLAGGVVSVLAPIGCRASPKWVLHIGGG